MRFSNLVPGDLFILRGFINDTLGSVLIRKIRTSKTFRSPIDTKFPINIKFVGTKNCFGLMREGAKVIKILA